MNSDLNSTIENVGTSFELSRLLQCRIKTISIVQKVASHIQEGMTERDCHQILEKTLIENDFIQKWHPTKFRIGKNTLKSFREESDLQIKLQKNDIFFLDIGPVYDLHECDYGETFYLGNYEPHQKISMAAREIFFEVSEIWKNQRLSGKKLYIEAGKIADKKGYILNLNMNGHRIGDFPHAIHYKGKLGETDTMVKNNLWVLEILIRHPEESFGAFYEDILLL